jgi:hypothetical protein
MKYFLDTEFIENGETIDLISIALVNEKGGFIYGQYDKCDHTKAGDWVARNVLPKLEHFDMGTRTRNCVARYGYASYAINATDVAQCSGGCLWYSRTGLIEKIKKFIGDDPKPEFWGYYADYDWVAFCQIFGTMLDLPNHFPKYCRDLKQWCDMLNNPQLPPQDPTHEHNALDDAYWNKDVWQFLSELSCKK